MNVRSTTAQEWWSWQWTATFAVMFGYFFGAMLWVAGFKISAALVGVIAVLLGMSVIASE
ncbi:hypothetical protein C499_01595 [Halogeometricum borinquense DSM 11551]|nr:hypothetical protein [Halogeometricum borinquense]ELY31129.1 hypothetical protein C499_01595 [Halogeometricum borinquense DSM 11551]RYJ15190.1 hypothetical protein ELS19_15385 [Halogeometricum borinquense]